MNKKKMMLSAVAIATSISLGFSGGMIVRREETFAKEKTEIDNAVSSVTGALSETNTAISLDGDEMTYVVQDAAGAPSKVITSDDGDFTYHDLESYEQPVDVAISYTLDGEEVSAEEIAGASGKVTIRFDYTNNEKVDDYYVPYIAISGVVLDDEVFSSVSVTHGKAIDDGNRTIAGGIAMPGMKYNIDPSGKMADLQEVPEYVEVSADAKNFELSMTLSLVMPLDLSDVNLSSFDGFSSLGDDMKALVSAAASLEEGGAKLASGTNELSSGLSTLSSNSESIRGGATAVFNSLLSSTWSQLAGAGITMPELTIENYAEVLDGVKAQLEGYGPAYAEAAAKVAAAKAQLDSFNTFYAGINKYTAGVDSAASGAATLATGAGTLASGLSQFNKEGIAKLQGLVSEDLTTAISRLSHALDLAKNAPRTKYIMRSAAI